MPHFHKSLEKFVTSFGNFGKCDECGCARESTALIRGRRYCKSCKEKKKWVTPAKFQDSDATFKCPAGSCGATKLSFREHIVGYCCEAALARTPDDIWEAKIEHEAMSKLYLEIREDNNSSFEKIMDARRDLINARNKVETKEEELKKAKENVPLAEKRLRFANTNEVYLRKLHEKSEKRVLIITNAAFLRDDAPGPVAKKAKQEDVNEQNQCKVCFHPYNEERPEAIIIPCAHKFCFNCITSLREKNCPNCRAKFTDNNVYKTH
ncbi:Oidioi.mRNA.OKI2018_I69.chr1.g2637.t1.cds [Oikopleura dioica]|uniref:Oidioi.mRNA.OKI2018_I69.chr1.g2637.t1.cds n=1 Tax=Oikopleura dioica TaxID=34765 RepID=A0ABN7SX45_OIKDI|nr:Oidioi.mRNA.OKI2018_I69.chr1.g2637.t1.cds [Oikopleura dioica]